jgi:predicted MFS family arabinose efflux permease
MAGSLIEVDTTNGDVKAKKARTSTFFSFLLCGIAVSAWAPMVPLAKERIGLNEAELGLILLAMGAGAILSMPFIGPVIQKKGSSMIMLVCSIISAAMLPLLAVVDSALLLALCLFIFGAGIGCLDVSMNSQAVVVQERMNKHIMSSFHGMFSVGGLIGAMVFGGLLYIGLSGLWAAAIISILLIVFALIYNKDLLQHTAKSEEGGFVFRLPKGPVILLGIFCFIAFLAEGALLDWSALFLREDRNFSMSMAGVGYGVFSVSMAIMRFTGDRLVQSYGPQKIVFWGAVLASAGLLISTVAPWQGAAVFGFFLIGIGAANIVPVLFSAAGKADPSSPELALAAVTTLGYAGQLAGPALIGFVAHLSTLPIALGLLAAPLLFIALTFSSRRRVASAGA